MDDQPVAADEAFSVPSDRMIERIVRAEARIESLKDDTKVIRDNIHTINNTLSIISGNEHLCRQSLESIDKTMAKWEPLIQSLMLQQGKNDGRQEGIRLTWAHIIAVSGVLIAGAAAIVATLALILHH